MRKNLLSILLFSTAACLFRSPVPTQNPTEPSGPTPQDKSEIASTEVAYKNTLQNPKVDKRFSAPVEKSGFTIPQNRKEYNILAFGDFGMGSKTPKSHQWQVSRGMVSACEKLDCDFVLGLGDNVYPSGVLTVDDSRFQTKFEEIYEDLKIPFFMTLGNRDYLGNIDAQIRYKSDRWNLPARHYRISQLPEWLTIYAMDTNNMDAEQLYEVKKTMCEAKGWKVLYGHHSLFTNGGHGDNEALIDKLLPIIRECKVQVYMSGHDHHLEQLSTYGYESVISGAAADSGGSFFEATHRPGVDQNFASSNLGFVTLSINSSKFEIRFHNKNGKKIFSKILESSPAF